MEADKILFWFVFISALIEVVKQTKPEWLSTLYNERPGGADSVLQEMHFSTGEESREDKRHLWQKFYPKEVYSNAL